MITTDEYGLYGKRWQGAIVDAAFQHPAKFSRLLIRWIYDHLTEEGLVHPGDRILDPFAGVALGALDAMRLGLLWTGVELEEKFVNLGQQNISLWVESFAQMPNWGMAHLFQGDSRYLAQVLSNPAQAVVSSPPYADGCQHVGGPDESGHMQGGAYHGLGYTAVVSSPPYAGSVNQASAANDAQARLERKAAAGVDVTKPINTGGPNSILRQPQVYGNTTGQMGAMVAGPFNAAICSPPWEQGADGTLRKEKFKDPEAFAIELSSRDGSGTRNSTTPASRLAQMERDAGKVYGDSPGQLGTMPSGDYQAVISSPPYTGSALGHDGVSDRFDELAKQKALPAVSYGSASGQLGEMPEGNYQAVVTSPPYEDSVHSTGHGIDWTKVDPASTGGRRRGEGTKHAETMQAHLAYSHNQNNMGSGSGETFWSAAQMVVEGVYDLLAPGGVAVWVVKDFVRARQRVDFTGQWARMCEAIGFTLLHHHRCWLVEERGMQLDLWGKTHTDRRERKSFFRRMAETKGSPRIDWESVLCMRKL